MNLDLMRLYINFYRLFERAKCNKLTNRLLLLRMPDRGPAPACGTGGDFLSDVHRFAHPLSDQKSCPCTHAY